MATYTDLSSNFAPNGPILGSEGAALRNNIIATAEGSSGAPYMQAMWHPYDGTNWDDGETGELWSFSTDGAQNQVTSPNFVDGYEYRFILVDLAQSGSGTQALEVEAYLDGDTNNWDEINPVFGSITDSGSVGLDKAFVLDFHLPRLQRDAFHGWKNFTTAFSVGNPGNSDKIRNVRFTLPGGVNFDQGAIYMHRRRSFY